MLLQLSDSHQDVLQIEPKKMINFNEYRGAVKHVIIYLQSEFIECNSSSYVQNMTENMIITPYSNRSYFVAS